MQWWNSFVQWVTDAQTLPVLFGAVVVVVAIVVASLVATFASRSAIKGLIRQRDREQQASAIGALVDAATEASVWNSLSPQEQVLVDRAVGQADIQLRLLPVRGSGLAADWAGHQLAEIKRTSATFGYQLDAVVHEFRDRLLDWQQRPGKARKIFQGDLERWQLQGESSASALLSEKDDWQPQHMREEEPTQKRSTFTPPVAPAPAPAPASAAAASAPAAPVETQQLLDDVEALDVRPVGSGGHSAPVLPA